MTDTPLATRSGTLELKSNQLDFILLDASSSMDDKWWDTLAAIDAYVKTLKAQNIDSHITLQTFTTTGRQFLVDTARDESVAAWKPLSDNPPYAAFGTTPLFDAVTHMGVALRDIDPKRCSIVIATDGDDTSSKCSVTQARAILDWCRAKGWCVTFIGCDFNNWKTSEALGARKQEVIGVAKALLSDAARALAKKRANYALFGASMHWSEDEQQNFGGYLAPPKG